MMLACRKCKRVLPLDSEFYFKNKNMKIGHVKTCRECQGHSFFKKEVFPEGKTRCSTCRKLLPKTIEYFHRGDETEDGFKSSCKRCRSEKAKVYRSNYRDELLEKERLDRIKKPKKYASYSKKYYNKVKDTDEYKFKQKKWWESYYERHQDRLIKKRRELYKLDPEKYIRITKKYQSTPKGQLSIKRNNHKRREREKNSLNWFTEKDWINCINHFDKKCCYCMTELNNPTMDHFIPLSKGGEFSPNNILPACLSCNSSKHVNSFDDWYKAKDFYSKEQELKILKYLGYEDNNQQMALF